LEDKLSSQVTKLGADIEVGESKVGELAGSLSKAEAELNEATAIRKKEAEEFAEGEKALAATVDTLERALSMLEKQQSAGGSFAQIDMSTLQTIVQSLSVVADAAALDGSGMETLTSLLQAKEDEADGETGAPAAAAYTKQSGGIMEILEDMRDKADGQLSELRKAEVNQKHSFEMLRQGLEDEITADNKELANEKSNKAEAGEEKASSEGNLEVTKKEKTDATKKNEELQANCQTSASDHEANVAARQEELKVIGEAEKILREATGSAAASFIQMSASTNQKATARQLASVAVIKMVQNLAKQQHSATLAQLASKVSAELKYSAIRHGADPFKKVNDLITSMIDKLEKEAASEATEKAYCDEEMSKTASKKSELDDSVSKLGAKIGKAASKSAQLKEEVSELQSELAVLTKEQAAMDGIRREQSAAYTKAKTDLDQGLGGVRKALSVLRDFYGSKDEAASLLQEDVDADRDDMSSLMQEARQPAPPQKAEKSTGAGTGIINLLEVVESDMAKNLATEDTEESDSATNYEKQTQRNAVSKAQKEGDVKGKTAEFTGLDKSISELESDKSTEADELSAVNEYFGKVKARCVAKPTPYEEIKKRRDAEISGLKDALASLETSALMQVGARKGGSLRGGAMRAN